MSRISGDLKDKIREQVRNRCKYCQMSQEIVSMPFEIEYILPQAGGGTDDEENLWLACRNCNGFKYTKTEAIDPQTSQKVPLYNPRMQNWSEHFEFSQDGTEIIGKTACSCSASINC